MAMKIQQTLFMANQSMPKEKVGPWTKAFVEQLERH